MTSGKNRGALLAGLVAILLLGGSPPALAQTVLGGPPATGGGNTTGGDGANGTGAQGVFTLPPTPIPPAIAAQAEDQWSGRYPEMRREGLLAAGTGNRAGSGQIQEAWNTSGARAGMVLYAWCADCAYKVRLRENMVTVLSLPPGARIIHHDVGAPDGFEVRERGASMLAVRPFQVGVDSSLSVFTEDGRVYPFYLRAEGVTSPHVPDLVVRIAPPGDLAVMDPAAPERGRAPAPRGAYEPLSMAPPEGPSEDSVPPSLAEAVRDVLDEEAARSGDTGPEDYLEEAPFDPDALRGFDAYTLWGDEALKPDLVFRDDRFTYIRFGDRWEGIDLPTAYITVDDIDELVNTRVMGRTYVVEAVGPLITLKSGTRYLCIQYDGEA